MRSNPSSSHHDDLFRERLDSIISMRHPLVRLAALFDWQAFDHAFGGLYSSIGRPAVATRLIVGLHYLKHAFNLSDEAVVERWVENPYWQYFCGFEYFSHELPIDPSSMTRWRQRIGPDAMALILKATVEAALETGTIKPSSLERVTVDTTVQPKAIAHPTDGRLYLKALLLLVRRARLAGIELRQSHTRLAKKAALKAGRYAHARQFKRMHRELKRLKTYLGRVFRDVRRKIAGQPGLQTSFARLLGLIERLLQQQRKDKNKLYSLHAPEVVCIAKGKAHKRYEFGSKVGVATTNHEGFFLAAPAFEGNPFDGHTLAATLNQAEAMTGTAIERVYVDRGYRGHDYNGDAKVMIAGQRRNLTPTMKRELKRRSAIEPMIGHAKNDGRLGRNWLLGTAGDKSNALLAAAGLNLRLILNTIRAFWWAFFTMTLQALIKRTVGKAVSMIMAAATVLANTSPPILTDQNSSA